MATALVSNGDLGGMDTYSPASKCSSALPHPPSQSPRHDQYEIFGLSHISLELLCLTLPKNLMIY